MRFKFANDERSWEWVENKSEAESGGARKDATVRRALHVTYRGTSPMVKRSPLKDPLRTLGIGLR
jgi:hypothetical protein